VALNDAKMVNKHQINGFSALSQLFINAILPLPEQKMLRGNRLNELKTDLGNFQQRLHCREGFSASLYVPNYRQDRVDAYENKPKRKKRGFRRVRQKEREIDAVEGRLRKKKTSAPISLNIACSMYHTLLQYYRCRSRRRC
jgi:hypothetical protein